jgi:lipopolysaccharide/colanic/teichoic acid biosynthesis glycosyltransferase
MIVEEGRIVDNLARSQAAVSAEEHFLPLTPFGGTPLVLYVPAAPMNESLAYRSVKRVADIAIAGTAILVFSPLLIGTAACIYLEDRGPVLYSQVRIGRYGVPFNFYKFRSMRTDADKLRNELKEQNEANGAHFKIKKDPRITRIGRWIRKFSVDEMPQLFSVLSGHMSIVGPRPHLPEEVDTYEPYQRERLMVKPGLLCLREISGRSELDFDQWVRSDIRYIRQRNLLLDLKILLLAIPAVITGRGAY